MGWLRQGLGLAAGCRCGVRSVAGAGRCRWAWLHRHGQPSPAGITLHSRGQQWAAAAVAESLPRRPSARLITICELSCGQVDQPASITCAGVALLVASAAGTGGPGPAGAHGGGGHPPLARVAAPRAPPPAAPSQRLGLVEGTPGRGEAAAPRVGDPTRSRDPKTACSAGVQSYIESLQLRAGVVISAGVQLLTGAIQGPQVYCGG